MRAYDCDPWLHIEFFSQVLTPDPPKVKEGESKSYGFNPGSVSYTQTWRSDPAGPLLPAFAYLRVLEQTGLPFKLAGQDVVGEKLMVEFLFRFLEPLYPDPCWTLAGF